MRKVQQTGASRAERFSWNAGYRAGYSGRPNQMEARHPDLHEVYAKGYNEGRVDREDRAFLRQPSVEIPNAVTA